MKRLENISSAQVFRCCFCTGHGANSFISGWWQENVPSGKKFTLLCFCLLGFFWHGEPMYFSSGLLNKVLLVVPTPQRNSHCGWRKEKLSTRSLKKLWVGLYQGILSGDFRHQTSRDNKLLTVSLFFTVDERKASAKVEGMRAGASKANKMNPSL